MKRLLQSFYRELPFIFSLPAVLWQVLFLVVPVAIIIYFSFTLDPYTWSFTWEHYFQVFRFSTFKIIGRSLFFALITAITALLWSYPVIYYLVFHVRRMQGFLLFLLTLPFWVNFLVQIYAWYFLLEYNGLLNLLLLKLGIIREPLLLVSSLFSVYVVMVYCYLPFMIIPLYTALIKVDKQLLDASADLGATPLQTFTHITFPLSLSGIRTGLLLILIPAFGEFVIPALLGGSKYMFVGSLISYYFLVARNNAEGAAFTCLSGFTLILILLHFYFMWHWYVYLTSNKKQLP